MKRVMVLLFILLGCGTAFGDAPVRRNKNKIPGQYLVMLNRQFLPTVEATAEVLARQHNGRVRTLQECLRWIFR